MRIYVGIRRVLHGAGGHAATAGARRAEVGCTAARVARTGAPYATCRVNNTILLHSTAILSCDILNRWMKTIFCIFIVLPFRFPGRIATSMSQQWTFGEANRERQIPINWPPTVPPLPTHPPDHTAPTHPPSIGNIYLRDWFCSKNSVYDIRETSRILTKYMIMI